MNKEQLRYHAESGLACTLEEFIHYSGAEHDNTVKERTAEWNTLPTVTLGYDSTADTLQHIRRVNDLMTQCAIILLSKASEHDASKLEEPEKSTFDKFTPLLKNSTYGSPEYKEFLDGMKVALTHHYKNNDHHPEHHELGINGMDLYQVMEMLMDWKAATERHADGNILKSLEINIKRFNIEPQLACILENTIKNLRWA